MSKYEYNLTGKTHFHFYVKKEFKQKIDELVLIDNIYNKAAIKTITYAYLMELGYNQYIASDTYRRKKKEYERRKEAGTLPIAYDAYVTKRVAEFETNKKTGEKWDRELKRYVKRNEATGEIEYISNRDSYVYDLCNMTNRDIREWDTDKQEWRLNEAIREQEKARRDKAREEFDRSEQLRQYSDDTDNYIDYDDIMNIDTIDSIDVRLFDSIYQTKKKEEVKQKKKRLD